MSILGPDPKEFGWLVQARESEFKRMMRQMAMSTVVRSQAPGVDPVSSFFAAGPMMRLDPMEQQREEEERLQRRPRDYNELIGAANAYRIPDPKRIDPDQLMEMIEQRRRGDVPSQLSDLAAGSIAAEEMLRQRGMLLGSGVSGMVGKADALLEAAGRMPWLGDAIARWKGYQRADEWLAEVEEGLKTGFDEQSVAINKGVAGAMAYAVPATATWRLAGAAGALPGFAQIGARISPLGRAAIRGTAAEWMIEGGGEAPLAERAINVGLGTVFGLGTEIGGYLGRTVTGAGIGAIAGAIGSENDPTVMAITAAMGATGMVGFEVFLRRAQRSFPSGLNEDHIWSRPWEPRPEGPRDYRDVSGFAGSAGTMDYQFQRGTQLPEGAYAGMMEPPLALGPGTPQIPSQSSLMDTDWGFPPDQIGGPPALPPGGGGGLLGRPRSTTAIRFAGEVYAAGPNHADAVRMASATTGVPEDVILRELRPEDDGYIIDGAFVNRDEMAVRTGIRAEMPPPISKQQFLDMMAAAREASALTKQTAILESPVLANLSRNAQYDDADVAWAIVESFPGQVGVVKNVGDVGTTVRRILQDQMPNGVGPQDFRVVKRPLTRVFRGESIMGSADPTDPTSGRWFTTNREIARGFSLGASDPSVVRYLDVPPDFVSRGIVEARRLQENWADPYGPDLSDEAWEELVLPRQLAEQARGFEQPVYDPQINGYNFLQTAELPPVSTQTDILVSSGRPITNKMVKEYETYGMFSGQRAKTSDGLEVKINSIVDDFAVVQPVYGGAEATVPIRDLLPDKASAIADDIPGLYESFQQYATVRLDQQAIESGIAPLDFFGPEAATQMPQLMDEFLKVNQAQGHYAAALRHLLEVKHVEGLRNLAPETDKAFVAVAQEAMVEAQARGRPLPAKLEDMAAARDMDIIPNTVDWKRTSAGIYESNQGWQIVKNPQIKDAPWVLSTGPDAQEVYRTLADAKKAAQSFAESQGQPKTGTGFVLIDRLSDGDLEVPVESREAAGEFLQQFQRETVDDSPATVYPMEMLAGVPGYSETMGRAAGEYADRQHLEDTMEAAVNNFERIMQASTVGQLTGGIGGAPPPPPPPPGATGGFGPDPLRLPPTEQETLANQIKLARKGDPRRFGQLQELMASPVTQWFTPIRNLAISIDNQFHAMGVTEGNFYADVSELQNSYIRHTNRSAPWKQRAYDAITPVRTELVRNGTLWEALNAREDVADHIMRNAGFNPAERQAVQDWRNVMDEFLYSEALREFPDMVVERNYVSWMRRWEAQMPGDERLQPNSPAWGAENARGDVGIEGDQLEKDVSVIIPRYFDGFFKLVEMSGPYRNLQNRLKAIPTEGDAQLGLVRRALEFWGRSRMYGLDPTHDSVAQGLRWVLNKAGKPLDLHFTFDDVMKLSYVGFSTGYRAQLGWQVSPLVRDTPQMLIGGMQVGLDQMLPVFHRYVKDEEYRHQIIAWAIDSGIVQRGQTQGIDADLAGSNAWSSSNLRETVGEEFAERREQITQWMDPFKDRLNQSGMGQGVQGTALDPMYGYGKLGDMARAVLGRTGYEAVLGALQTYVPMAQNLSGEALTAAKRQLLKDSRVARYQGAIQREFLRRIDMQDYEGAARFFGAEVANSQNIYGMSAHPMAWQQMGPLTGRIGMRWKTFTSQTIANNVQILSDPAIDPIDRAAYAAQVMSLQMLFAGAQHLTGWNFMRMGLVGSIVGVAGTSLFDVINTIQAADAHLRNVANEPLNPSQLAMIGATGTSYGSTAFTIDPTRATWNPARGAFRTIEGIAQSAPYGPEAIGRFFTTGQTGDPYMDRLRRHGLPQGPVQPLDQVGQPWVDPRGVPGGMAPQPYGEFQPQQPGSGALY